MNQESLFLTESNFPDSFISFGSSSESTVTEDIIMTSAFFGRSSKTFFFASCLFFTTIALIPLAFKFSIVFVIDSSLAGVFHLFIQLLYHHYCFLTQFLISYLKLILYETTCPGNNK